MQKLCESACDFVTIFVTIFLMSSLGSIYTTGFITEVPAPVIDERIYGWYMKKMLKGVHQGSWCYSSFITNVFNWSIYYLMWLVESRMEFITAVSCVTLTNSTAEM